jgi:hypothetical protein
VKENCLKSKESMKIKEKSDILLENKNPGVLRINVSSREHL